MLNYRQIEDVQEKNQSKKSYEVKANKNVKYELTYQFRLARGLSFCDGSRQSDTGMKYMVSLDFLELQGHNIFQPVKLFILAIRSW